MHAGAVAIVVGRYLAAIAYSIYVYSEAGMFLGLHLGTRQNESLVDPVV